MNYLTNYYKNLCEQLQQKLNLLENAVSEEEEKAKKRAEQMMHWGPRFLFQETTGRGHHGHWSLLDPDEQAMWTSRYATAREVFHNKDFMGTLPAKPKERNAMLAREIARVGDIGLDDAHDAIKAHEMAGAMASTLHNDIVAKRQKEKLPSWVIIDGPPKKKKLPPWVIVDGSPSSGKEEDDESEDYESEDEKRPKSKLPWDEKPTRKGK